MYIVRYSTTNDLKLQIFIDRSFKTEAEAKAFIEKIRKSDAKQGLKRVIEYQEISRGKKFLKTY